MKHSESLEHIAPALIAAQGMIQGAIKDANNPFFKSSYADLESCWDAVKPALQANGLAIVQTMSFVPEAGPSLITMLLHSTGEYISGEQPVCAKTNTPQDMGSAITYARRYGLSAIVGLIQVDDDGHAATKPKAEGTPDPQGTSTADPNLISEAQLKRLFAIQKKVQMPDANLKVIAAEMGIKSRNSIPKDKYNDLCHLIENWKPLS